MSARDRFRELLSATAAAADSVADLGDRRAENRAVRGGCGLGLRADRGYVRFAGEDRHDFLHRMLTASIRPRVAGAGTHTLLLDGKGHVLADLDLLETDDCLLGCTGRAVAGQVVEVLSRYVLRAQVSMEPCPDTIGLALVGPGTRETLDALGVSPPEGLPSSMSGEIAGAPARVLRTPTLPAGLEVVVARDAAIGVAEAILDAGAVPVGADALEMLRIEAGIPAHGAELTGTELPQEARLEAWVDFDKGCYLGQETVARLQYRGHVNRLLCGFQTAEPLQPATDLLDGDRTVGTITSAGRSDRCGPIALGYLRRDLAEEGTVVATGSGVAVRVSATPMN